MRIISYVSDPFVDEEGIWSGEVDISIMALPDNPLDDDDYHQYNASS